MIKPHDYGIIARGGRQKKFISELIKKKTGNFLIPSIHTEMNV